MSMASTYGETTLIEASSATEPVALTVARPRVTLLTALYHPTNCTLTVKLGWLTVHRTLSRSPTIAP
jgi:hypothetical protein